MTGDPLLCFIGATIAFDLAASSIGAALCFPYQGLNAGQECIAMLCHAVWLRRLASLVNFVDRGSGSPSSVVDAARFADWRGEHARR